MKRIVKITYEIEELVFFKTRKSLTGFCQLCGLSVEMLTTEKAASLLGLSEFQIFRLIETGNFHFVETERIYICRNSLEIWLEALKVNIENFGSLLESSARK